MSGDLEAMLKRAAQHKMTPAEEHAQRRSWVIGQMMLSHPEMTRKEAEKLADGAVGPNLAARVAELEAEIARLTAERDAARASARAMHRRCQRGEGKLLSRIQHLEGGLKVWQAENERLRRAVYDSIRRPMGVVPDSAAEFYSAPMADEAEARRPRLPAPIPNAQEEG